MAELDIDKNLIGNEYLLPKSARFEDEVAESDKYSEEEMALQDPMNNESQSEDYMKKILWNRAIMKKIYLVTVRRTTRI